MSVSDDFNRANGGLGANWTTIKGTFSIVSNAAKDAGTFSGDHINAVYWSANSFSADHTSQATVQPENNNYYGVGGRLKDNGSGAVDGYIYFGSIGQLQVIVGGLNSTIASIGGPAVGDTFKIGCASSTITGYINGVSVGSTSDSTWNGTGTAPGLADYAIGDVMAYDDWIGTGEIVSSVTFYEGIYPDTMTRRKKSVIPY